MDDETRTLPEDQLTLVAEQALARVLAFGASFTTGILVATAVNILLASSGWSLDGGWRVAGAPPTAFTRAAIAWWAIAGSACATSWITVWALTRDTSRLPLVLTWAATAIFVAMLASAGHAAGSAAPAAAGISLAVNLSAMTLAAVMAAIGARGALLRYAPAPDGP